MNKNLNANQFIRNQMSDTFIMQNLCSIEWNSISSNYDFFIILVIMRKNNSRRHITKRRVMLHEQDIK